MPGINFLLIFFVCRRLFSESIDLVVVCVGTIIMLIIECFKGRKYISASQKVAKYLMITGTGLFLSNLILFFPNHSSNYFGEVHTAIAFGLSLIALVVLILGKPFLDAKRAINYSWINNLIFVYGTIFLWSMMYIHFGTQFVWIPAVSLGFLGSFFIEDPEMKSWLKKHDGHDDIIIGYGMLLAAGSTAFQFADSVVLGIKVWIYLISMAGIFFAWLGISKYVKAGKIRLAKQRAESEYAKALQNLTDLSLTNGIGWDDIWSIYQYGDERLIKNLLNRIEHFGDLRSLIKVSCIKQQITWDDEFKHALIFINAMAEMSYSDKKLEQLMKLISTFLEDVKIYKTYTGHQKMLDQIDTFCPLINRMFEKQEL